MIIFTEKLESSISAIGGRKICMFQYGQLPTLTANAKRVIKIAIQLEESARRIKSEAAKLRELARQMEENK